MSITSRCVECGAGSLDGSLSHAPGCSGNMFKTVTGYGMMPPANELIFDSEKERKAFMKKLMTPGGTPIVPSEHNAAKPKASPPPADSQGDKHD